MFLRAVAVAMGCHTVMLLTQFDLFCWNSTVKDRNCGAHVFNVIRLEKKNGLSESTCVSSGQREAFELEDTGKV